MPFALVFVGLIMVVVGARGTQARMGQLLVSDFTGKGNFTYWLASLGAVGAIGYIPKLQTISRALLVLIIVAIVIANKGFAQQFTQALAQGPTPTPGKALPTSAGSGSSSSGGDLLSGITTAFKLALAF